jgi:hypothetical protein
MASHGLELEHEVPVYDGRSVIARLDLADPESRAGLECQSWQWHSTPAAKQRDNDRKRRVRQLGWDLTECWWTDRDRMDAVAADLRFVIERQRKALDLPASA